MSDPDVCVTRMRAIPPNKAMDDALTLLAAAGLVLRSIVRRRRRA